MNLPAILTRMGFGEQAKITPFKQEESGEDYAVWKVEENHTAYVLKKTSEQELSVYHTFFPQRNVGRPGSIRA